MEACLFIKPRALGAHIKQAGLSGHDGRALAQRRDSGFALQTRSPESLVSGEAGREPLVVTGVERLNSIECFKISQIPMRVSSDANEH